VELGFYGRPATAAKLKQALGHGGMPLFQTHSCGRDPIAHRLDNYQVVTNVAESQSFRPDQIWFTTPSRVYYSAWFREFLQEVPSDRVVCFAPEGGRPEFTPEGVEDRLVFGGVTFMAWQSDLEGGGGRPEGVNFWLSPLGILLMGKDAACRDVAQLLRKARFRVTVREQDSHMQASITAVMTAFVAGLELSGWSLGAFRKSPWLSRAAGASREGVLSQLPRTGAFQRTLLGVTVLSTGFFLATFFLPFLVPFDLEKYLQFHYLKTREQTLTLLDVFARDGKRQELPMENINVLLQGLLDSA
jgi:hypothetical protein